MPDPSLPRIDRTEIDDSGPVRIQRAWHENGRLIKETRLKRQPDGRYLFDGESRQWASDGKLIGSFTFQDDSGVFRSWYDNGQVFGEITVQSGLRTGLQRGWGEGGYLMVEKFWFRDAVVSKKKYRELQAADSSMPQYGPEVFESLAKNRNRIPPTNTK